MNIQVRSSKHNQRGVTEKTWDSVKVLNAANDLFVKGRFEEVIKLCKVATDRSTNIVFKHVKNENIGNGQMSGDHEANRNLYDDCHSLNSNVNFENGISEFDPHKVAKDEFVESVCLLAIQSFAELDQWKQVDPFLLQCFEKHQCFPPRILFLCIKLYSHVSCFELAEYASLQWLSNKDNSCKQQYPFILERFVKNVLIPQKKEDDALSLIKNCSSETISLEKKEELEKYVKDQRAEEDLTEKDGEVSNSAPRIPSLVERISNFVSKFIPPAFQRLAMLGFFIYVLLFRSNLNIVSYSTKSVMWRGVIQAWRALFAPFHMMSS